MVENKKQHGQGDQQRCDCDYANNSGHTWQQGIMTKKNKLVYIYNM